MQALARVAPCTWRSLENLQSIRPTFRTSTAPHSSRGCPQQQQWHPASAATRPIACDATSAQSAPDIESYQLPAVSTEGVQQERAWLCAMLTSWLDEEWTPLEVHRALATEAASAYAALRAAGERDVASILLSLSSQLLSFNYRETFTDAFEVSNKIVEYVMVLDGCDVCCTSQDDAERFQRFRNMLPPKQTTNQQVQ